MYHQFAFSGVTVGDTDYGDEAPKRKAEGSGNAMRPQKRLHFTAPNAMETLPIDILLLLTDYLNTKDMIHLLQKSKFSYRLRPQRLQYRQALLGIGIENVGPKVLDKAYFNHELTVGASQLEAFSEMLKNDKSLKSLKVENSDIDGIKALSEALKINSALEELSLADNNFRAEGARAIGEALKVNTSVTKIDLSMNLIGDEGARAIAEALEVNTSLTHINLNNNKIGAEGGKAIAEALKKNTSLEVIDLSWNNIGDEGGKTITEALKVNTSLKVIDLAHNKINNKGAIAIAEALKANSTLEKIDIGWNYIKSEGAKAIAEALEVNTSLKEIRLNRNEIPVWGIFAFARVTTMERILLRNNRFDIFEIPDEYKEMIKNNKSIII